MKTLKAGTKKYLLIDAARVERNTERAKRGDPVVMVIEVAEDGVLTLHRAFSATVKEGAQLEYQQNKPLKLGRGITEHAAWATTGEVELDVEEPAEEAKASAAKPAKPTTPKTPKE